jgi:hypothetical protein
MFGNTKTTNILDDKGSTVTLEKNIVNNEVKKPIRQHYEWKTRVHNQIEEHQAYLSFSDELAHDKTMLDPSFRIEKTKIGNDNGYYYVIRAYTQLEY